MLRGHFKFREGGGAMKEENNQSTTKKPADWRAELIKKVRIQKIWIQKIVKH